MERFDVYKTIKAVKYIRVDCTDDVTNEEIKEKYKDYNVCVFLRNHQFFIRTAVKLPKKIGDIEVEKTDDETIFTLSFGYGLESRLDFLDEWFECKLSTNVCAACGKTNFEPVYVESACEGGSLPVSFNKKLCYCTACGTVKVLHVNPKSNSKFEKSNMFSKS